MAEGPYTAGVLAPALALALAAQTPVLPPFAPGLRPPVPGALILEHPCPRAEAGFGQSVALLDLDGNGVQDLAVGAYLEGLVYVHFGRPHATPARPFDRVVRTFTTLGPAVCGVPYQDGLLGYALHATQLDGDAPDELVAGAPGEQAPGSASLAGACYLYGGVTGSTPTRLAPPAGMEGRYGNTITAGDFDGDGVQDLVISAPQALVGGVAAGRVIVLPGGPLQPTGPALVLDNPFPILNGNYGHNLAVGDGNSDGIDDLYVGAIGNTAQGVARAGQVFFYPGPLDAGVMTVIEDPFPDPADQPGPRYSMHIHAREHFLAVGANRKDHTGLHDPGMGYVQSGPLFQDTTLHVHPTPVDSDYLGFRCQIGDFVGDSSLDFAFLVLRTRQLAFWDGDDLTGPPLLYSCAPGSADHLGNGTTSGRLFPLGREQLILGDPTFDDPRVDNGNNNCGRVVVYTLP